MRITILLTVLPFLGAFAAGAEKNHAQDNVWLFEVNGKQKTVRDLHGAYSGFLVLLKEQVQQRVGKFIPEDEFAKWVEAPETAPDKNLGAMLNGLSEEAFAAQYQDMELVAEEARKKGFAKLPATQAKLRFFENYYLANLYIFSRLNIEDIVVTEPEIAAQIEAIKSQGAVGDISKADLRAMAVSQVTLHHAAERQRKLMESIRQQNAVKLNPDADIADILKQEKKRPGQK